MKKLLSFLFLIMVCCPVSAQDRLFVRIFDLNGEKMNKGYVVSVNDSVLRIKKNAGEIDIPIKTIGTIRTKRSTGHNILIGTLISATVVSVAGAASADPDAWILAYTPAEGALMGAILGAPVGAVLGLTTAAFKNPKKFEINGEAEKWKAFLEFLKIKGLAGGQ